MHNPEDDLVAFLASSELVNAFVKENDLAPPLSGHRYGSIHGLMLGEALLWQPAPFPPDLEAGPDQGCFANAARLADSIAGLTYVEGFAVPGGSSAVHHAWCVTDERVVVDPTWAAGVGLAYWGVPLTGEYRAEVRRQRGGISGPILDPDADESLLIVGLPPGARENSGPGAPRDA
jgi:hypothetical protein